MSDHQGLPVSGYKPQSDERIALVNVNKADEEKILRMIDAMQQSGGAFDQSWLAIARTQFELAYMALNRSIFRPARVRLPEDSGE